VLRSKPLRSKKRINRVSTKHRAELAVYSDTRKTYLLSHPYCEVCGCEATDIHHKARRGKNLNNTETWMALCRCCHSKVEANGKWAREMGYIID
jgi:hypothetical protein